MALLKPNLVKGAVDAVQLILVVCSMVIFQIIGLLVFIAVFPLRQFVKLALPPNFQLMEPLDAFISKDYGSSPMMMTACGLAQLKFGPEHLEKLRSKLHSKIVSNSPGNYSKLRFVPRTKFGFRCWEDVGCAGRFDIRAHVKLFPGGEDWDVIYSETELMSIVNQAINQEPVSGDENKPKWELLVVPQVRAKGHPTSSASQIHVALIVRVGHGYMDGNSVAKFVQECIFDEEKHALTIPAQGSSSRAHWSFSRRAVFFLKMLSFGIFNLLRVRIGEGMKSTHLLRAGRSKRHSGFIGKVKVGRESVRKVVRAANSQTSAVPFVTAFLTALRTIAEGKELDSMGWMNVAFTKVIPATNDIISEPQNRFALCPRCLPAPVMTEASREIMKTINDLIHITPDNEYEALTSFYLAKFFGFLPDVGMRTVPALVTSSSCLISLTPMPDQMFKFQGGLITSSFGVPPYGYGTCYALGITNYGGAFYATLLVERSSLIQTELEFQELLNQFQDCLTQLEKNTC